MYTEKIQIEIDVMGSTITITTDGNERESLIKAVDCLNKKFETIKRQLPSARTNELIILASLNLIREFMKMKDENGLSFESINNRLDEVMAKCDDILKQ